MRDLGIISCTSVNLPFKKCTLMSLFISVPVFATAYRWKSENNLRIGSLLPLCGFWGPMDTEPMDKKPTSLNRSI